MQKLISKKTICERTSLSRATIDRYANDPAYAHLGFPKGAKVGGFRKVWSETEITSWIEAQLAKRGSS
jgi:predicted DNA-binding transcriptional regulator AlpA